MSYSSRGERLSVGVMAHVMRSRLLSVDDYWALLSSDSMEEVAQKLLRTSYERNLGLLPSEPHRFDIEAAVKRTVADDAARFTSHLTGRRRTFFLVWQRMGEAEALKSIFRRVAAGFGDRDELRRRLGANKGGTVSFEKLLESRSFSQLLDALSGTKYEAVLEAPMKRLASGEVKSLFSLELALDNHIEYELTHALKSLETSDRERLSPLFGARADIRNLYMVFRASRFYKMSAEETISCLLPYRHRVNLQFLRSAARRGAAEEGAEGVLDMIREAFPGYARIFEGAEDAGEPFLYTERNIRRYICREAARLFGVGLPDFHTVVSYFVMKDAEIADIIRIIECIRYGWDRRKAAENLIRPIVSGGGDAEWQ